MEEVKNYIRNHKQDRKPRNNDYKFKPKATK